MTETVTEEDDNKELLDIVEALEEEE